MRRTALGRLCEKIFYSIWMPSRKFCRLRAHFALNYVVVVCAKHLRRGHLVACCRNREAFNYCGNPEHVASECPDMLLVDQPALLMYHSVPASSAGSSLSLAEFLAPPMSTMSNLCLQLTLSTHIPRTNCLGTRSHIILSFSVDMV